MEHRFRPAAKDVVRRRVLGEEFRNKTALTKRAVVAGQMDFSTGGAEVVDAGGEIGRPYAVIERNVFGQSAYFLPAIAAHTEKFADVRQERRLPDAAGDKSDMGAGLRRWEAVAERSPDLERVAHRTCGNRRVILPTTR